MNMTIVQKRKGGAVSNSVLFDEKPRVATTEGKKLRRGVSMNSIVYLNLPSRTHELTAPVQQEKSEVTQGGW